MSLLAEEIVEEWLNRQGYFTIRGIKVGNDEIDLLAIKPIRGHGLECRHLEVSLSINPIGYIYKFPKDLQKAEGRSVNSAKKRNTEELQRSVSEWIEKKFKQKKKEDLRSNLAPGQKWSLEFVVHRVKSEEELKIISSHGIIVHRFPAVISEIKDPKALIRSASGADLLDLVQMGQKTGKVESTVQRADCHPSKFGGAAELHTLGAIGDMNKKRTILLGLCSVFVGTGLFAEIQNSLVVKIIFREVFQQCSLSSAPNFYVKFSILNPSAHAAEFSVMSCSMSDILEIR